MYRYTHKDRYYYVSTFVILHRWKFQTTSQLVSLSEVNETFIYGNVAVFISPPLPKKKSF